MALKTIHPELLDHDELLRRFRRESEVLGMVSGEYTARVLDGGVDAGRPYLVMKLPDGRPLDLHLREQGPIRTPEALGALALALAVDPAARPADGAALAALLTGCRGPPSTLPDPAVVRERITRGWNHLAL
ncbi:hypothetical protein [Streptomyces sp. NPDC091268]|uniref:hypothetical protein n=1 Tax=Streptomyces sp. NPDC091268 TaxID=3365979 RepID=UPI003811BEE3